MAQELVRVPAHKHMWCRRKGCGRRIVKGELMSVIRTKGKKNAGGLYFCTDACATEFLFDKHMTDNIKP